MRSLLLFVVLVVAAMSLTHRAVDIDYDPEETTPTPMEPAPSSNRTRSPKFVRWNKSRDEDSKVVWHATVDGPHRPTREKAHAEAVAKAAAELREALALDHEISHQLIEKMIAEEREKSLDLGPPNGTAQSISLDLSLTAAQARELAQRERSFRVRDRLSWLSRLTAVLVAGLFAVAGYVRLDEWSKGYYTRTLRVTAMAAFGAAAFFVWKAAH